MLEVLVTFQERFRDEASDMLEFPNIYPNVDGLSQKHGQGIQIRRYPRSVCHKAAFLTQLPYQTSMLWWGRGWDPWMWHAQLHTKS
jgi:hypothetical protein